MDNLACPLEANLLSQCSYSSVDNCRISEGLYVSCGLYNSASIAGDSSEASSL